MTTPRRPGCPLKKAGTDITDNVNLRMVTPEERAMLSAGGAISDHIEETILSRLPASLRDEAIWQYHVGCGRGLILRYGNQSIRYIPDAEWIRPEGAGAHNGIPALLDGYDPTKEALMLTEYPDSIEVIRIDESGRLTLLQTEPLTKPSPVSRNGTG
jgi:hypothetical protein